MAVAEITGSLLVLYRWKFKGASPAGGTGEIAASRRADQLQEVSRRAGVLCSRDAGFVGSRGTVRSGTSMQSMLCPLGVAE